MRTMRDRFVHLLLVAVCACTPAALVAQPVGNNSANQSSGIWTARWWQWAMNKTVATSPLLGPTGENPPRPYCEPSGVGSTWFVGGSLGWEGPLYRTCSVPAGAELVIPVANYFFVRDPFLLDMFGRWPLPWSKDIVRTAIDGVTGLVATVDGKSVQPTRVSSPAFPIVLPPGHIYAAFGYPAGIYNPATSDGYWLMLPPLAPGPHTITLHANFVSGEVIALTYVISVAY